MPHLSDNSTASSREKLIQATINLMSSRGFEAMGINSILEAADVTKSNFYYHFKSKEELCLAALDAMAEYFFQQVLEPILNDKKTSPKKRLEKFFRMMHEKVNSECCERGCPFVNLATETSDFIPAFREKIDAYFRRYRRTLSDLYKEGVEKGEFRADISPDMAALSILSGVNGTFVLAKAQKDARIVKDSTDTLLALFSVSKK